MTAPDLPAMIAQLRAHGDHQVADAMEGLRMELYSAQYDTERFEWYFCTSDKPCGEGSGESGYA